MFYSLLAVITLAEGATHSFVMDYNLTQEDCINAVNELNDIGYSELTATELMCDQQPDGWISE